MINNLLISGNIPIDVNHSYCRIIDSLIIDYIRLLMTDYKLVNLTDYRLANVNNHYWLTKLDVVNQPS